MLLKNGFEKKKSHLICIDHKKKNTPGKAQTKADLIQYLKTLKSLNDALENKNRKNMVIIEDLKEKLYILHKKETVNLVHGASQTGDSDLLLCDECEFPAETCN